ncbi:unnamed protein product [Protopolystoma xenopodis]|uniref:Dynein heavy chain C-terminal domain-containing protein n=1 Tax=Protopolystoma xenopodis TaxID=117903 RepID=A0A448WH81_9PLAT|nr:unnamed protein product [Protopolystoma xenopodis]
MVKQVPLHFSVTGIRNPVHASSRQSEDSRRRPSESACLPVYFERGRNTLVTRLAVPCPRSSQDSWTRAGVALFLRPA